MSKIGKEYRNIESFNKCMVVYIKDKSLTSQGEILVKHDPGGREWLTHKQLDDDYVEW